MPVNPLEELVAVMEQVTGRRPEPREVMELLLESAVGREGWFAPGAEMNPGAEHVSA